MTLLKMFKVMISQEPDYSGGWGMRWVDVPPPSPHHRPTVATPEAAPCRDAASMPAGAIWGMRGTASVLSVRTESALLAVLATLRDLLHSTFPHRYTAGNGMFL